MSNLLEFEFNVDSPVILDFGMSVYVENRGQTVVDGVCLDVRLYEAMATDLNVYAVEHGDLFLRAIDQLDARVCD